MQRWTGSTEPQDVLYHNLLDIIASLPSVCGHVVQLLLTNELWVSV